MLALTIKIGTSFSREIKFFVYFFIPGDFLNTYAEDKKKTEKNRFV